MDDEPAPEAHRGEVAAVVMALMEAQGWDCYPEVMLPYGGRAVRNAYSRRICSTVMHVPPAPTWVWHVARPRGGRHPAEVAFVGTR